MPRESNITKKPHKSAPESRTTEKRGELLLGETLSTAIVLL